MRSTLIIFILAIQLLIAQKEFNTYTDLQTEKITIANGPEDMVLDTMGVYKRIIISCSDRRKKDTVISSINYYLIKEKKTVQFKIINLPDSIQLKPHGIDIGVHNGAKILWVVNHGNKKQSILKFAIDGGKLFFLSQFRSPYIVSPNDVCDGGNGTFYLTNDASSTKSGLELLFKIRGGSIVYYDGYTFHRYKTRFAYPNGIIKYNGSLYVSTSRQNKVFKINLTSEGNFVDEKPILVTKGTCWDNFSIYDNKLVCTSHYKPTKFLSHYKKSKNQSPTAVYFIDPKSNKKQLIYNTDGSQISAGSTAIIYKNELFICQVFDGYILKVDLK